MEGMNWNLPVLALRGLTVFPHMSLSLDVEREVSLRALEKAMEGDQRIFLVTQREIGTEAPEERDLYEVGTVCAIRQILKMSGSTVRILVDGLCRAKLCRLWQTEPYLQANVEEIGEAEVHQSPRVEALLRRTAILFGAYAELVGGVSDAARAMVLESRDPSEQYRGTALEGLDAFQRQLKRPQLRLPLPREAGGPGGAGPLPAPETGQ